MKTIAWKRLLTAGTLTICAGLLAAPATGGASVVSRSGPTIYYYADQGERNDVLLSAGSLLGQTVYTLTDRDVGIRKGGGLCDIINGVGMCGASGVTSVVINSRDRDDTITVATGTSVGPVMTANTLIGGRGVDVITGGNGPDKLKGNNGRDSLRGRKGADVYKGGRGSDTLQALDGQADTAILCGEGRRDLLRSDRIDPRPRGCELGGHRNSKRR